MRNTVRNLRLERGVTQTLLAKQCGISRQTLNELEHQRSTPSLRVAMRLTRLLGKEISEVFADS